MVKTLIVKTAHYLNQKALLSNLGNLPKAGNKCIKRLHTYFCHARRRFGMSHVTETTHVEAWPHSRVIVCRRRIHRSKLIGFSEGRRTRMKEASIDGSSSHDVDITQCSIMNTMPLASRGTGAVLPGLGFSARFGFLVSSGFLGIFWPNMVKSGFLRHCRFSPHFITTSLTILTSVALNSQLQRIRWYLFCYNILRKCVFFLKVPLVTLVRSPSSVAARLLYGTRRDVGGIVSVSKKIP